MTRALFVSCLLGACASAPAIPLEQACAEGQRGTTGWLLPPDTLAEYWELSRDTHFAVVARWTSPPAMVPPRSYYPEEPRSDPMFYGCVEVATHEVIDGLGWVDDADISIAGSTGESYWGTNSGRPLPDVNLRTEFFYDEFRAIAPDDGVYLLILQRIPSNDMPWVRWAARVEDGMVAGDNTISGEPTSLDAFRR